MEKRRIRKVRRADRAATAVITVGGIGIIISVIGILALIIREALPLFLPPTQDKIAEVQSSRDTDLLWTRPGDYGEQLLVISRSGRFQALEIPSGRIIQNVPLPLPSPEASLVLVEASGADILNLYTKTQGVHAVRLKLKTTYGENAARDLSYSLEPVGHAKADPGLSDGFFLLRTPDEDTAVTVQAGHDSALLIQQTVREKNFLGEVSESAESWTIPAAWTGQQVVTALAVNPEGSMLFAGSSSGQLIGWHLGEDGPEFIDRVQAVDEADSVTALAFILGGESVAVGTRQGSLSAWSVLRKPGSGKSLAKLHDLPPHDAPVQTIQPSYRHRALLSMDDKGTVQLSHVTSERLLYRFQETGIVLAGLSSKGTTLGLADAGGRWFVFDLHNPHPETSASTLFGKTWYESYPEPDFVWQSSSASDDFEPKLSLVPLIFGSLKGTFYAMLFSVPLALLGAMYVSQFTTYRVRGIVKPAIEIMAAIPSVVVGFLAALWFAPLLERNLTGFFLSLGFLPVFIMLLILAWHFLRSWKRLEWVEKGYEFLFAVPGIILAVAAAGLAGGFLEKELFDGSLKLWMYRETGTIYDPRNCIVIAFALGFAVIPIIFTIAEDAFSNVPAGLRAASLALGASRWQTVWRVILPSASPGIFAGIVIGLGRAVGETMIVLMATGNTPIMDWSAFNGMRTLSANIAVEIPEAPVGGTLYRVLFLSAVVLFGMTFVLNTGAEIVRQKLRKRYGQFQ